MGQKGCSGFSITSYEKTYFGSDPLQYLLYIQKNPKNPNKTFAAGVAFLTTGYYGSPSFGAYSECLLYYLFIYQMMYLESISYVYHAYISATLYHGYIRFQWEKESFLISSPRPFWCFKDETLTLPYLVPGLG